MSRSAMTPWTMLHAILLFISLSQTNAAKAGSDSSKTNLNCRAEPPLMSVPFRFAASPPKYQTDLSLCQQYRQNTCCNKTHTNSLVRLVAPYFSEEVSTECKNKAAAMLCATCDPLVGTGQFSTVCEDECNSWFSLCKDEYFSGEQELVPCDPSSLVCFRLHEAVSSGKELCEALGFRVHSSSLSSTSQGQRDAVDEDMQLLRSLVEEEGKAARPDTPCWRPGASPPVSTSSFKSYQRQPSPTARPKPFYQEVNQYLSSLFASIRNRTPQFLLPSFVAALVIIVARTFLAFRSKAAAVANAKKSREIMLQKLRQSMAQEQDALSEASSAPSDTSGTSRLTEEQLSKIWGSAKRGLGATPSEAAQLPTTETSSDASTTNNS